MLVIEERSNPEIHCARNCEISEISEIRKESRCILVPLLLYEVIVNESEASTPQIREFIGQAVRASP
jgi:hypothetical protein